MVAPDNLTHVMLREIREKQDEHSQRFSAIEGRLAGLEKRVDDLHGIVVYSLGQSTETSFKQSKQERRIDEVFDQLEKLLSERQPS